jgi:tryptophan synthase alpha chain
MDHYHSKQNRSLFVPFITAGDPDSQSTVELALMLQECGADALELGIPFSDPLADGPVIQRASQRALQNGMTLKKAMRLAGEMRQKGVRIPIIIFTYYNLLLQLTLDTFFKEAKLNEIDGLLVPDLPFEESGSIRQRSKSEDISLISLVSPTTSDKRMEQIGSHAQGFLYCVSSLGVTGTRKSFDPNLISFLERTRRMSNVPVLVGFGISSYEQIESLSEDCDGVIVGSAIVKLVERYAEELKQDDMRSAAIDKIRHQIQTELLNNGEVLKAYEGAAKNIKTL